MTRKESIRALGIRFRIETPHVEQVARLALDLFDRAALPGFGPADRGLLCAAARLHDIGYAADPEKHVTAGVRILMDNPLPCFSPEEWASVILIVSLHRRKWRPVLTDDVRKAFKKKRLVQITTLAAMLRIADGLDHGHIQDVSIRLFRRGRRVDRLTVRCRCYAGNIPWAEGKSDLWTHIFKKPFRVTMEVRRPGRLFDGVVHKNDSALSAARRILYSQYDMMRDQVPGLDGPQVAACLHDYRVALRRFRCALRLFRPLLKNSSARDLEPALSNLSDRLGPIRDAHVLLDFFQTLEPDLAHDRDEKASAGVLEVLQARVKTGNDALLQLVASDRCTEIVRGMSRLLRVELPALGREEPGPRFAPFVKKRLARRLRPLLYAPSELEEGVRLHQLRKDFRRARYLAEFAAPVAGHPVPRFVKPLRCVADALGDLRDDTLHLESLLALGLDAQSCAAVGQRRRKALRKQARCRERLLELGSESEK